MTIPFANAPRPDASPCRHRHEPAAVRAFPTALGVLAGISPLNANQSV